LIDFDITETNEWLASLAAVIHTQGTERARFLLERLRQALPHGLNTAYCNSLATDLPYPGDLALEAEIEACVRWNAAAMVVRANRYDSSLGGHLSTFASAATLYEVGFQHCWRAASPTQEADCIYIQGHAAPGIYARAFLEGRLTEEQLGYFRQEAGSQRGLSSYPHPWLMPTFWQFPTVSMGLGPLQAIYQARLLRYMQARGLTAGQDRKVWCFCGDGEMDEPESTGALSIAAREQLDNLIFVINCNLQRLDGPVRGNGKIVQELEAIFLGAGWHVIKVLWNSAWDPLFQQDHSGKLLEQLQHIVDGEYQSYQLDLAASLQQKLFAADPQLAAMVAGYQASDFAALQNGGHDARKVYTAYQTAMQHQGQPVVVLVQTVKGYSLGPAGEGLNTAHNVKKLNDTELLALRDRLGLPISDTDAQQAMFYRPPADSAAMQYLHARRQQLHGYLPQRRSKVVTPLEVGPLEPFTELLEGSGERTFSTTMAMVRIITKMCRHVVLGKHVVPIIPDEARTFGMEGLFRQLGIYSAVEQRYTPIDSQQVMYYKESTNGQILQEGINEAGAFASWLTAATAYSTHNCTLLPFYMFYSMFGMQRIGDLAWAAGDSCARGFLVGATAGRTTLSGEGLQHGDGHSHILASTIPNCISYDPCFAYELAVIVHHGITQMLQEQNVFYYLTVTNESYEHPALPAHVSQEAIIQGMYLLQAETLANTSLKVRLLGSGTILREVLAAAELLQTFNVTAEIWSVTSFTELARDHMETQRWNLLHPQAQPRQSYVSRCLQTATTPVIAASDYQRQLPEQLRSAIAAPYTVLGTDGFGRSDTRAQLRKFFEMDRFHIVVAALYSLQQTGQLPATQVQGAIERYQLDPESLPPWQR
jgi:pyruvate dehydrogenase E1 component